MEISFVCLRENGCLELPATVETACRTASRKVPELESFHFHTYSKVKTYLQTSDMFSHIYALL